LQSAEPRPAVLGLICGPIAELWPVDQACSRAQRGLLHSRAAFGIALPVAGE